MHMQNNEQYPLKKEEVLIEALPYMQQLQGETMMIKVGGHAMVDPQMMENVIRDLVLLRYIGLNVIIVHGGGPEITRKMELMGHKPTFVGGLRVTNDDTLEVARMVLVGNVNTKLISLIGKYGGKGVGLSGKDGRLIIARKLPLQRAIVDGVETDVDIGWVGEPESINPEIIDIVMKDGYIPVISPISMDADCNTLNLNADTVAADVAAAVSAKKMVLLTDVAGILKNPEDASSCISRIGCSEIPGLIDDGIVTGGMIPKVKSAVAAIEKGVESVHIIDGSKPHTLILELLTDAGIGTMIYRD